MPPCTPDTPTKHYNIGTSRPIYFEDELGRRSEAKLLSKDEARRIAANIAKSVTEKNALRLPTDSRKAQS
jgi:hypothetical protein